jgi:hypothetical protein
VGTLGKMHRIIENNVNFNRMRNISLSSFKIKGMELQKDLSLLPNASVFYMKKGFQVTYNSSVEWKSLQYCDWYEIFSQY